MIPDLLGITLGARYTHENKEFQGTQQDENSFVYRLLALPPSVLADPGDPSWLYPLGLNKQKFNNFSFRVGAEYHFDRDIMAYASYATAFKAGGWTTRLTGRSEEHTSELHSLMRISYASFGLKKKTQINNQ